MERKCRNFVENSAHAHHKSALHPGNAGFFLYYPGRRQMRPPLKALADFLRSAYRGMPPAAGREAGASRGVGAPARATPSP